MKLPSAMKLVSLFLSTFLLLSTISNSYGLLELEQQKLEHDQLSDLMVVPQEVLQNHKLERYLVFGHGTIDDLIGANSVSSISTDNGFFSITILSEQAIPIINAKGYHIMKDFPLEFHTTKNDIQYSEMDTIRESTGAELAQIKYNYTGNGIKIAIVDTGVDFSNPDLKDSLARDERNYPTMLDADGQGIIITNATFVANIDKYGVLENTTKPMIEKTNKSLAKNTTSNVYLTKNGVFLNLKQKGKGTPISIYNSFFPSSGLAPIFNGTILDDYKIGKTSRDYIKSATGVYHFGMIYQGSMQGPFTSIQAVPVLVVDSQFPGVYDTIIPDLTTSWQDYTKFDLKKGQKPTYDFDFTDESPIQLGNGNEFLVYDSNKDGKLDYSAGIVGAQVVDVYGVFAQNKSSIDKFLKATNGTLLPPMDSKGNFFGVMTDFVGHGTGAASSIASKGKSQYDVYNNTKKYTLPGIAPNAKIIPVKALWFGDSVYGWLWASGFDSTNGTWKFSGKTRADIISNSWGISNFPSLKTSPGVDILSLIVNVLCTPQSIDAKYPGVVMISSAGNAGHGYGTIGLPNAASFGITVGATTNNVYVGYGQFKGQPRFGNTTEQANNVVDFSSRGPSIIGDPKPDLMNTGAYGFIPSNVLKAKKDSKQESFSMFGGTSMAAPLVAGSAAILMEGLKEKNQDYDPFMIKNILMSTATDLQNDPFTQGSGLVNSYKAVQLVNGKGSVFLVYNNSTYDNIKKILDEPMTKLNSTLPGFDIFELPDKTQPQTSWFAGRLVPGEKSSTTYTIENPSNQTISVQIIPQKIELIQKYETNSTTKLRLKDSLYNKTNVFRPDYIKLENAKPHDSLFSYYDNRTTIPQDAELMVLNLNFAFSDFLNKTEKLYASDTKIASLYLYDWNDKNKDDQVSSAELSLVNRGGTWGTVQEMRVSEPNTKFANTPLVGIYPVPTRYSYWLGEIKKNATEMNYVLSASYYKKQNWSDVWVDNGLVEVPSHGSASVSATVMVPDDAKPGVYQGFIRFIGANHTANAPISFAVTSQITQKDKLTVISGKKNSDVLYGNGYIRGAFDMTNRYNAGDWRQYYFDIKDSTINTASFDISWKNPDTNFSVFMIDPQGKIIQTNVPAGAFGQLLDWPTSDWLGTTVFSEGGGFYPVKNKDSTSTLLYAPINQTGTYTLLLHSTLFGGQSTTEPFTVMAKFSSIFADDKPPEISFPISQFVNGSIPTPIIIDDGQVSVKYYLDDKEINFDMISSISEGLHNLRIDATDEFGNTSTQFYSFIIDKTIPEILVNSPKPNNSQVTNSLHLDYVILDENPGDHRVLLPNGTILYNQNVIDLNTGSLKDGQYEIIVIATDKANNTNQKTIPFKVEKTKAISTVYPTDVEFDYNFILLIIAGIFAIGITIFIILGNKSQKLPKY